VINKERLLYDTIRPVSWQNNGLRLLDQRQLPKKEVYLDIPSTQALYQAIKDMVVRGAPAIGIAAAYGAVLAAKEVLADQTDNFDKSFNSKLDLIASSRPTAINLFNALNTARTVVKTMTDPANELLPWANEWLADDIRANLAMGELGATCFSKNTRVLTHCNAGALATGGYGTALGVIRSGVEKGLIDKIYAAETRPWNQGARLTLWELEKDHIQVTLIADSSAASLMQQGLIDWVVVGADTMCMNGDIANKIGTYSLAVLAKHHRVKVMVVAPTTTLDSSAKTGKDITIEHRSSAEILPDHYSSELVDALNPVFDVTPATLISAIVTEKGMIESPDVRKMAVLTQ
tara:strand:+ start:1190 stop:2230 length:1041 start_codon:yes stop_codon:yes gene_type:complete